MYSWPATQSINTSTLHGKGAAKRKEKNALSYPVLDYGTVTAATLLSDAEGRLEWTSVSQKPSHDAAFLKAGKSVTVFPATRPAPSKVPQMTIHQRAEQGAHFLRTFAPDIDIAAELMRKELTDDAKIVQEYETFDPYVGNQLETVACSDSTHLVFPMGELNRDLNLSPLITSPDGEATLRPCAQSIHTFDTPIRQITASQFSEEKGSYLAIRTFGPTSLLELKTVGSTPRITELASVSSTDTGGKQVVDVKIAPLEAILVNQDGAVYKCNLAEGKTILVRQGEATEDSDSFWRLESAEHSDSCMLMSKSGIKELDFRAVDSSLALYTAISNDILTSVEDYRADEMIRVCTTSQVVWLDRRNAARPLLAFKHGRVFDRTLQTRTIRFGNGHLTMLSSRKNGLLTVYDVSHAQTGMAFAQTHPYCLRTPVGGELQTGRNFFRHPLAQPNAPVTLFSLSELGSIRASQLSWGNAGEPTFNWSEDVGRLHDQSAQLKEDFGSFGEAEPKTVDMSSVYAQISQTYREESDLDAAAAAESLYDLVEKAPSYWQDLNDPVEHMLTSYDVLFRSGDEPSPSRRADFLTESVFNSKRGYRALLQGRVSSESLAKDAQWNHSISDVLHHFDPDMSLDARQLSESLRRFDLQPTADRSPQSLRRESEAREQLVLDLTLAQHVYSSRPFAKGDSLESMTQTLSLDGEPPPMSFGYLHPIPKEENEADEGDKEEMIPLSVRLLLKDWDIGTKPKDFAYIDPYSDQPQEPEPIPRPPAPEERPAVQKPHIIVQQPPPIVSTQPTRSWMSQDIHPASQPTVISTELGGASQDMMASTQILPGAFGGRPVAKKKVAKKRLGGF
ncbi:hypothetical protein FB45DRAFT_826943 [Roridomyces roridus]|uniref:RRN6 beta-propeller domain-containing protein n=1 Tax=Roridomyces roridus TaxID=1738132 RepID=A0AAD7FUB4_9AGAR|nr:hypothetical protein FB45DRAFT_826943 [Roridomyces roridus]